MKESTELSKGRHLGGTKRTGAAVLSPADAEENTETACVCSTSMCNPYAAPAH